MFLRRLVSALCLVAFAPIGLGLGGCGGSVGNNAASQVLKKPELPDDTEAKCSVRKSQSEPLIVEWPNAARGRLESTTRRGLIAIKYEGCELTQLPACTVKASVGQYAYWPITRKQSKVVIKDTDDLYASMPVGAVKLEGKLKTAGQLDVNMTIIGRYEAPTHQIYRADLEGTDCEKATHVIAAITVGSFTFSAGGDAEVGAAATVGSAGAGGKSTAKRETLQSDGDETACAKAKADDKGPPEGCGALLQIEVVNLTQGKRPIVAPVVAPAPVQPTPIEPTPPAPTPPIASNTPPGKPKAPPKCKKGERVEDGVCVKLGAKKPAGKPAIAGLESRSGTGALTGTGGLGPAPTCSSNQHLENNRCVENPPPEPVMPPPPVQKRCAAGERLEGDSCIPIERPVPKITHEDPKPVPAYEQTSKVHEEANPWRTVLFYGAIGAGIVWTTASLASFAAVDRADKECPSAKGFCTQKGLDERDSAKTFAIVSDISLGVTALALLGFFLVPATVKVGAAPTKGGGFANVTWSFK